MTDTLSLRPGAAPSAPAPELNRSWTFSTSLVMLSRPQGEEAESIRTLRTNVVTQLIEQGRRATTICGPGAGVGCTFVAANLAVSLSQIGLKTLLIDANLRRPGLDALFRTQRTCSGLAECLLADDANHLAHAEADVLPNLSVMFAGKAVSDPQTLLAKDRFRHLMDSCMRDYDVTIIDTPPANSCADARLVSSVIGYSIVVARAGRTFVQDIKVLIQELESDNARVIGTVLNQA